MPTAEVDIDEPLVRGLLGDQHPDLADLALAEVASGWDNVVYRLGDALTVRLPRRHLGAELVEHEQRWLPELAPRLPLPIPAPVRVGRPGRGYPWSWSVVPWFEGTVAAIEPPVDLFDAAETLGRFLVSLHRPAPPDAPVNPYRGVPLAERSARMHECVEQLGETVDRPRVEQLWADLVVTPRWAGSPLWLHGDLHPANLLVRDGRLAAVIDFGDITGGDPATDLAVAWMLFPAEVRPAFRVAAGDPDADTWERARGWALAHSIACLAHSADNALIAQVGARTLREVLADAMP